MRVSLFRMDRMAYAGAKGITVCIFPDGRTGYSKDDKTMSRVPMMSRVFFLLTLNDIIAVTTYKHAMSYLSPVKLKRLSDSHRTVDNVFGYDRMRK
jgi:hypothetical protein